MIKQQRLFLLKAFLLTALSGAFAHASESVATPELMTPNEAISGALAEPLQYVGSFQPNDSISRIPTCIFRNSKVTVKYTYCRQKEAPALGLSIYSNDTKRGHVRMYAEGDGTAVSKLKRKQYLDAHFSIISRENLTGYKSNFSAQEFGEYYEKESKYYNIGCQIWQWATDHSLRVDCIEPYKAQEKAWVDTSIRFWVDPHAEWYELQNVLRAAVAMTPVP